MLTAAVPDAFPARLGPLLPWQQRVLAAGTETTAAGTPFYRTVVVTVPRQAAKSSTAKLVSVDRCRSRPYQNVLWTAQSGRHAARVVVETSRQQLTYASEPITIKRAVGNESVTWANGSAWRPFSPNASGAHGESIDLAVIDEAWAGDFEVMGAVIPAMAARPQAQLWIVSTAGTAQSRMLADYVEQGRDAVTDDTGGGLAYFEWACPDNVDVFDEARWHQWHPGLEGSTTVEAIRDARERLPPDEFRRAFGNLTIGIASAVIPEAWWQRAAAPLIRPDIAVAAVEVNNDPAGAAIATAHTLDDGRVGVRLLEWRQGGPEWVAAAFEQLTNRTRIDRLEVDTRGPARVITDRLADICTRRGIPFGNVTPTDAAAAAQMLINALATDPPAVLIDPAPPVDDAARNAARKDLTDGRWVFDRRRMQVDASPLIAVTYAHRAGRLAVDVPAPRPAVYA